MKRSRGVCRSLDLFSSVMRFVDTSRRLWTSDIFRVVQKKVPGHIDNNNILFLKTHYTSVSMLFTKLKNIQ